LVIVVFAFDVVVVVVVVIVVVVVTYPNLFLLIVQSLASAGRVVFSLIWSSLKQHSEVQNISHSSRRYFDFIKTQF
jgi:hypothetical protein